MRNLPGIPAVTESRASLGGRRGGQKDARSTPAVQRSKRRRRARSPATAALSARLANQPPSELSVYRARRRARPCDEVTGQLQGRRPGLRAPHLRHRQLQITALHIAQCHYRCYVLHYAFLRTFGFNDLGRSGFIYCMICLLNF